MGYSAALSIAAIAAYFLMQPKNIQQYAES